MKYDKAKKIADRIIEVLTPHCEPGFIHIAGSVRREKDEVKDIEVCAVAKKEFIQTDLFGGGHWSVIADFGNAIFDLQESIVKGSVHGRYMQIVLMKANGLKLDLFLPQKDDYYRQYAIRTGSREYSQNKIAASWLKNGWCGTSDGLRRIADCYEKILSGGKRLWTIVNSKGERPPVWRSEEEFFRWLEIDWIPPQLRELKDESFKRELYR